MSADAGEATAVSLFSGVGGMDEGLRRAGFRHVLMCEGGGDPNGTREERQQWAQGVYRRSVLRARFPGVPVADDVREVVADSSERQQRDPRSRTVAGSVGGTACDLLCGGFPCQDLSVAGRRAGFSGKRSSLFFEFARIADELRPRWLLIENVPGLYSSCGCAGCRRCRSLLRWHSRRGCPGARPGHALDIFGDSQALDGGACAGCRAARSILARHTGTDFAVVRAVLRELGYGVAFRTLDSRYFGVPQRRRRVFIVGALADGDPRAASERAGQVLAVGTRCPGHPATRGEAGPDVAVASLSGLGSGGPDDNDGQGGRLIADTVRSYPRPGSNSNGNLDVVANTLKSQRGNGGGGIGPEETLIAAPLSHGSNPNSNAAGRRREDENLVAFNWQTGGDFRPNIGTESPALQKEQTVAVQDGASVRRLTPTECERLQGLPDGWTDLGGTPDSKRYAALGDAVTVLVAEWIGRRILAA